MYVEKINSPADIKKYNVQELEALADEIRELIIEKVSACGGHLASNLGVVELTIALHYIFDAPNDKFIFDVSHQTYCHKILTGRKDAFILPEKYASITGFSNPLESEYDLFTVGHTSTSLSLACGLAKARDINKGSQNIVAVIGDASLDGGEAFEALNCMAELNSNLIVVINDNEMSIPENHGALGRHLKSLRLHSGYVKNNFFESLGLEYYFVENGNNIYSLLETLTQVKGTDRPVVVHVCTQKGRGYSFAEKDPERWHWARPFDREAGVFLSSVPKENYGNIVAEHLLEKIKQDSKIVVMAASTPGCIGFNKERRELAGKQYIDVGIAEENAVTMMAAMAKGGCKPVLALNATFLQRAYDQIEQEMCLNQLSGTIIVTHASIYGHCNDTHVGILDIPLLTNIPNLTYLAPINKEEYMAMLDWSIDQNSMPVAIRVPWTGVAHAEVDEISETYAKVSYQIANAGEKICIMALGGFFGLGQKVARRIEDKIKIRPTLINPRFITGIDNETLEILQENHDLIVTIEDGVVSGGFGAKIAQYYSDKKIRVCNFGFSMEIPRFFDPQEFIQKNGLTETQIVDEILNEYYGAAEPLRSLG